MRDEFMIGFGYGKGQDFTHETTDTLTKGTIPAFLVSGLTSFFADSVMRALREDDLVSLPEITRGALSSCSA